MTGKRETTDENGPQNHESLSYPIMTLLVTLLLCFTSIILMVRYVDICVLNLRTYNTSPASAEDSLYPAFGAGIVCLFLAIGVAVCLSAAGSLEGWHYTLMTLLVLLVGYQTWRVFLGRQQ